MRFVLPVLALAACSPTLHAVDARYPDGVEPGQDTPGAATPGCSSNANLSVVTLDGWARPLHTELSWSHAVPDAAVIPLGDQPVDLGLSARAAEHLTAELNIRFDGSTGWKAFDVQAEGDARWAASWQEGACPTLTLYVGLEHAWFASSAPPPSLNDVTLLMDGEEAWGAVYDELVTATESILWATWYWQSDFALIRNENDSPAQRMASTAMALLESSPAQKQILVNRFWGDNLDLTALANTDAALRAHAEAPGDGFEVMLQGNPVDVPIMGTYAYERPTVDFSSRVRQSTGASIVLSDTEGAARTVTCEAASWHQKFMVFDEQVAFVGGMNTKDADWDTSEHRVFEPLRLESDATFAERQEVADRLEQSDTGPRKDYMVRIEGPAVRDIGDAFSSRWNDALADGLTYAENASQVSFGATLPPVGDGVLTQVVQTLPDEEMSIMESHIKALRQAEAYIFIEDQFFRSPILNEVIVERMTEVPELRLVVVTKPVSRLDPGLKYTYLSDQYFRSLFPDRYQIYQLATFDVVTDPGFFWDDVDFYEEMVDVHSKLRIIDDRFVSVGSANFNNRGLLYEGEMSVNVLDGTWATAARRRVFENLVGPRWAPMLSDDPIANFDVFAAAAADNAAIAATWRNSPPDSAAEADAQWMADRPSGFLMPVTFSSDYIEVGPDIF